MFGLVQAAGVLFWIVRCVFCFFFVHVEATCNLLKWLSKQKFSFWNFENKIYWAKPSLKSSYFLGSVNNEQNFYTLFVGATLSEGLLEKRAKNLWKVFFGKDYKMTTWELLTCNPWLMVRRYNFWLLRSWVYCLFFFDERCQLVFVQTIINIVRKWIACLRVQIILH